MILVYFGTFTFKCFSQKCIQSAQCIWKCKGCVETHNVQSYLLVVWLMQCTVVLSWSTRGHMVGCFHLNLEHKQGYTSRESLFKIKTLPLGIYIRGKQRTLSFIAAGSCGATGAAAPHNTIAIDGFFKSTQNIFPRHAQLVLCSHRLRVLYNYLGTAA